jgi:nitroreductase
MDYWELLRERRSVRNFQDRPVPTELIEEMLRETVHAPSAMNGRPWEFVIVQDREWIQKISDESKASLLADLDADPSLPVSRYADILRKPEFNVFYNAPSAVIIAGPESVRSLAVDCALAAAYFMFAATARGLGTCWIGLGRHIRTPEIRESLGLSESHEVVAPIALGYPEKLPGPPTDREPRVLKVIGG